MLQMLSFAAYCCCSSPAPTSITLFIERVDSARLGVAVRAALGATRQQILRQFAIDGVVLAAAGAALGIPLAYWIVRLAVLVVPPATPRVDEIAVHVPVLMLAIAAATVFGAVLALGSAWRSTRTDGFGVIAGAHSGKSIRSGFGRMDRARSSWPRRLRSRSCSASVLVYSSAVSSGWSTSTRIRRKGRHGVPNRVAGGTRQRSDPSL